MPAGAARRTAHPRTRPLLALARARAFASSFAALCVFLLRPTPAATYALPASVSQGRIPFRSQSLRLAPRMVEVRVDNHHWGWYPFVWYPSRLRRSRIYPPTPQGHGVARVAAAHRKLLLGHCFKATSPNGRFAEGARVRAWMYVCAGNGPGMGTLAQP